MNIVSTIVQRQGKSDEQQEKMHIKETGKCDRLGYL